MSKSKTSLKPFTPPDLSNIREITAIIEEQIKEWEARDVKSNEAKEAKGKPTKIVRYREWVTIDALHDKKKPAVQWYFDDFLASNDCRIMKLDEFGAYHWLIYRSANDFYQAFLAYDINDLRTYCNKITKSKFNKIWEKILYRKFKFAKHDGKIYIYNPRFLKEILKLHENRMYGSMGGTKTQEQAQDEKQHLFKSSPYYDVKKFVAALKDDTYFTHVDGEYYYQVVLNWARNSQRPDWILQAKAIILNHMKEHKLMLKNGVSQGTKKKIQKQLVDISTKKEFTLN